MAQPVRLLVAAIYFVVLPALENYMPSLESLLKQRAAGFCAAATVLAASAVSLPAEAATYKSLHDFYAYPDGYHPIGGLIQLADGKFYGVTDDGGYNGMGTIFSVTATGEMNTVYSFKNSTDGAHPSQALVLGTDGALYGTSISDGGPVFGAIFRFSPATGALSVIHSLPWTDQVSMMWGLTLGPDGALYGLANGFGDYQNGIAFRCATTGKFSVIHVFTADEGGPAFNRFCVTPDKHLYGTTYSGGQFGKGIVFAMSITGHLLPLHSLSQSDGYLSTALTAGADGKLWGVTNYGGASGHGGVYRLAVDGSSFSVLHSFTNADGMSDYDYTQALTLAPDGRYYGSRSYGGPKLGGTIFSISGDGTFKLAFAGTNAGDFATRGYLVSGKDGSLYGLTYAGGAYNAGSVFRFATAGSYKTIASLRSVDGSGPGMPPVLASDGNYYGATSAGGRYNNGTIYKISPAGNYTILRSFSAQTDGYLKGVCLGPDGYIYGNTDRTAFRVSPSGILTKIASFSFERPLMPASDGKFYFANSSTVYSMTVGGAIAVAATSAPNQNYYLAGTVLAPNGKLYAVTQLGGAYGHGAILKATPGGVFNVAYSFKDDGDGHLPFQTLAIGPDGNLYGATFTGTTGPTVFRYRLANNGLTVLHRFEPGTASILGSVAVKSDGSIYGIGVRNESFIYKISPSGAYSEPFILPHLSFPFPGVDQQLTIGSDGTLMGVGGMEGIYSNGVVYTLPGL